ncbi:hypothetical protein M404DRAFT_936231 [Pisolithus tinctorius Marx 270]|uniref:Uncharacterized protein n=1 Tax=Pisolithus tinctorius Marx 270 TaxID=870435 RepID=A0A0C3KH09_PISTI|nr:hypothetical protein M404DRAFT_936231 [Pisolithus tinctorius Marx 270]
MVPNAHRTYLSVGCQNGCPSLYQTEGQYNARPVNRIGSSVCRYRTSRHSGCCSNSIDFLYRCTVLVGDEGSTKHILHRVIRAYIRLKNTERPESRRLFWGVHAYSEGESTHRTDDTAKFCVDSQR